jgi:hypothetical protein
MVDGRGGRVGGDSGGGISGGAVRSDIDIEVEDLDVGRSGRRWEKSCMGGGRAEEILSKDEVKEYLKESFAITIDLNEV